MKIIFLVCLILTGCAATNGYKVTQRPSILDNDNIIRINPNGDGSQVKKFLQAYDDEQTAGLCEIYDSEEGTPNDVCFITENGSVHMIVDYTQDEYGIDGYRISKLKYKGKNKFYNLDNEKYYYLLPYED